jgi:triacylglycerol lipase
VLRLTALILLVLLCAVGRADTLAGSGQCVVLLHGLWRTEVSMLGMALALKSAGYDVANITYPSLLEPIEVLAERAVPAGIEECREHKPSRIHFVTHSLGGILVRQYLHQHTVAELGRVVMLGPPNQGSELADAIYALRYLRWLQPQAVPQLGTGEASVPRNLGPVDFELGVIAGTEDTLGVWPFAPEAVSDGTVAVSETRVEGMADFIAMSAGHTFMMWQSDVQAQVLHFLAHGRFVHQGAK